MNKFDRDLSYGQYAELYIGAVHPTWVRNGGLGVDFTLPNGKTLELKAERRSSWETANIAVEIESSPGTPALFIVPRPKEQPTLPICSQIMLFLFTL